MHFAFPFLPLEIQTSIREMLALGVPESAVDLLVERTAKAIEAKTTSAQRQVIDIGEAADRRLAQMSEVYEDRLRILLGETNGMIVDIRTAVQGQEAAAAGLRADFQAFGEAVSERLAGVEERMEASETDRQHIHQAIRDLNERHGQQLGELQRRLAEIERLLEIAGQHEAER